MRRARSQGAGQQNGTEISGNGDINPHKISRYKLRGCPMLEMLLYWASCFCLALIIPYLANNIPPTPRSDISWWMSGIVYQVPAPKIGQKEYLKEIESTVDHLHSLGITCLRLSNFFPVDNENAVINHYAPNPQYGDLEEFETFVTKLDSYDMKLMVDFPMAYTSTIHAWFLEDRLRKSDDTTYVWSTSPIEDSDDKEYFTTSWKKDSKRQEFYQYRTHSSKSALLNFANAITGHNVQHVLEFWLRRGIDGFILMQYDTYQFRNKISGDSFNHIETEDPCSKKINNLVNLTQSFRKLFDFYNFEYEGIHFLGLDLASTDTELWHALYNAGADMIINHEFVLSSDKQDNTLNDDFNPYWLKHKATRALARVPGNHRISWKICDENTKFKTASGFNTLNMLNMLHLLLPGAPFLCPGQVPQELSTEESNNAVQHFKGLTKWRDDPSISWGYTQTTLVDEHIFSFARFAHGRNYPRYLYIANFADSPQHRNFSVKNGELKVGDRGMIRYYTCLKAQSHTINSLLYLDQATIQPRCGLLVELKF